MGEEAQVSDGTQAEGDVIAEVTLEASVTGVQRTVKAGTTVLLGGVPVVLKSDSVVENYDFINEVNFAIALGGDENNWVLNRPQLSQNFDREGRLPG
jgi:hypothetical protein